MTRHFHRRKPKGPDTRLIDRVTLVSAFVEPLVTIPQIIVIFKHHRAEDVSLTSWIGYELVSAIWLWYGIVHKDRAIIVYHTLFLITQSLIIAGILLYR